MKKYKFITPTTISTLAIAIAIGIFGVLFFGNNGEYTSFAQVTKQEIRKTFLDIFNNEKEELEKDNKNFNEAIKYKNNNSCKLINNQNTKQECNDTILMLQAEEQKDFKICEKIKTEKINQECNQKIIETNAIEKKNKKLCNALTEENRKKYCQETIDAKKLSEILLENNITKQKCEELENNFKTECLKAINIYQIDEDYTNAINNQNIALCTKLEDKNLIKNCKEEILYNKAIKEKNVTFCEYIENIEQKNHCIKNILPNEDSEILKKSIAKNDLNQCLTLSNTTLQNSCNDIIIFNIVKSTKNIQLCKSLKNEENISICETLKD